MSAKTKIMVVKMREIIYTLIFLALIVLLIVLLVIMFTSRPEETKSGASARQTVSGQSTAASDSSRYVAGVYTTPISLGDSAVDVEVIVDENHINSIRLVNLSETATAMYPLVSPSLETIALQICQNQSLENITCPESNKYTAQMLLNAVAQALKQAERG